MLQMFCKVVEVVVGQSGEADIWKTFGWFSSSVKLFPIRVQLRADGFAPFFNL